MVKPQNPKHFGEGGIRTLDTVAGTPDFESGAFSLSATSPGVAFFCRYMASGFIFAQLIRLSARPSTTLAPPAFAPHPNLAFLI